MFEPGPARHPPAIARYMEQVQCHHAGNGGQVAMCGGIVVARRARRWQAGAESLRHRAALCAILFVCFLQLSPRNLG